MNHTHRLHPASFFTLILLALSLICGCARSAAGRNHAPYETYTAASGQESSPSGDQASPETRKAREDFETFCDDLFRAELSDSFLSLHYSLADPNAYGLGETPRSFGEFSLAFLKDNSRIQKEQKLRLDAIPCRLLTKEQQLTYQILKEAFRTEALLDGLELYYQPLAPTVGLQAQLPILLAEYTFYDKEDVEDYLALLSSIDTYFGQILEFEREKSKAGLFMTDACVDTIVEDCAAYLSAPQEHFLTATFDERLSAMADLTPEEKAAYQARNAQMLTEHFIPGYELLLEGLKELKGTAANDKGLSYFPEGKAYYEYLIRSSTGTTCDTVEQLRDAIENQMNDDLAALYQLLQENEEVSRQLDDYTFAYTEPREILERLKLAIQKDFPALEQSHYTTKYVPSSLEKALSPAFFLVPPMDRYQDCVIYINNGAVDSASSLYTTLAHEGYPGHLYQNIYFLSHCSSPLRKILNFGSYSEGWATYAEYYAYTTDNGLSPELGQLLARNASATLGLYALLDININYYGWDPEQVASYLSKDFGITNPDSARQIYQHMVNAPVNYLDYYTGYLEILRMKEQAEETLKSDFRLKDFHQFVLDIGPAPFTVIKPYFDQWLASRSSR